MDVAFTALLFFVSLSGLLLLLARQTAAMGGFLAVQLGLVAAFFLVLPYGKFVHVLYRFAALVRFAAEGSYPGNA
jgi:citrate/tricarballylate utilization protein